MKSLTFITGNPNKAEQLRKYLEFEVEHKALDLEEIQSLDIEEVARKKAQLAYQILGTPVLVEDTALSFTALNGLPGTLIKWFFESIGNDGLCKLLLGYDDRSAIASTCFALCDESGVYTFTGSCTGRIPDKPSGDTKFGWNPIFIPENEMLTWAEMTSEQSVATSIRRRAINKLHVFLDENYV